VSGAPLPGAPDHAPLTLNAANLAAVLERIPGPTYDRAGAAVGIVHLGVGSFHRAHQAMYVDRLMNGGQALDWAVCGVGVLPGDQRMAEVMAAQDGLYTLLVKHPDGRVEPRVIGSIVEYLFAPADPERVVERMSAPEVRIVSLTVTEGGYNVSPVSGEFDGSQADVAADLRGTAPPTTTFGLITEALSRRRDRGIPAFTVVSCDNIAGNGDVARRSLTAFAGLRSPELGAWVEREVAFPNSMVDRITPVTTQADRDDVLRRYGIVDAWPVACESFSQWVIAEEFSAGRPPLEAAGVQVVDDVEPYELMKLRLLNAGHQALCYVGYLAGYRLVDEVAGDPLFASFLLAYMRREGMPTLPPVPGIDLDAYCEELVTRFGNAAVRDTVARLCAESSDRIPTWLLPVVRYNLAHGGPIELSAAVVASWARYDEGVDEQGEPIEIVDRLRDDLVARARRQRTEPLAFLGARELFGDLAEDERFTSAYSAALDCLHAQGARATVEMLLRRHGASAPAPAPP